MTACTKQFSQQLDLYQQLMQKIHEYFGEDEQIQPLSVDGLELMYGKKYLEAETKARTFSKNNTFFYNLWDIRVQNFLGSIFMKLKLTLGKAKWGRYKEDTLHNSDYRKLDDTFRIVFAAKKAALAKFETWLASQEEAGTLIYGLHISDAAQLTCLISQVGVKHLHFVDGCDGGYALAAKTLKLKQNQ